MITNRGKDIIARYLAGQVPAAFSHIAVGVGARPKLAKFEDDAFASKTSLDFEAIRVPISSASIVQEGGKTKIVFSGTLPTDKRYEITEIGIYPAQENSLLTTTKDSLIFSVVDQEGWTESGGSDILVTSLIPGLDIVPKGTSAELTPSGSPNTSHLLTIFSPGVWYEVTPLNNVGTLTAATLDGSPLTVLDNKASFRATSSSHTVAATGGTASEISIRRSLTAFFVPATDPVVMTPRRILQRSRLGDDLLLLRGDYSIFSGDPYVDGANGFAVSGSYVYVENPPNNFSAARGTDEFKVGVSILPKTYNSITTDLTDDINVPQDPEDDVRVGILLSFEFSHGTETASAEWRVDSSTITEVSPLPVNFTTNQYYVLSKQIQAFRYSAGFQWSKANMLKVYAGANSNGSTPVEDYWISIDAIRFDSRNDNNPIYGLVSYSTVTSPDESPQVKTSGLESQIEYKVGLDSEALWQQNQ